MSSEQSSAWKDFAASMLIVTGLLLAGRLAWQAWDARPRGKPLVGKEFYDAVKEQLARDRANFERDWIASGKPIPPGGFDAMFRHSDGEPHPEGAPASAAASE